MSTKTRFEEEVLRNFGNGLLWLVKYPPPHCYWFRVPNVDLLCCVVKSIKEVVLEEVRVAIARWEHRIEVIWNVLPKRGYRPWVAWVHCLGCVVEAIVIRAFEKIGDTVGVSEKKGNESVYPLVFNWGGLMVSALDSEARGPGSSPGRGTLCCVLGQSAFLSQYLSPHPGV